MATFTELVILREEERVLIKIASKLNDQLNRLKVEELALNSLIRRANSSVHPPVKKESKDSAKTHAKSKEMEADVSHTVNNKQQLDLNVKSTWHDANEMEEEFDEEDDDEETEAEESMKHDQLTAFLEQMELQFRKQ